MSRRTTQRVVVLIALTAILLFAYAAVNHWHSTLGAQDHCVICHVAHSLSIGVSCGLLLAPVVTFHRVLLSRVEPSLHFEKRHASSRAPPLAFPVS